MVIVLLSCLFPPIPSPFSFCVKQILGSLPLVRLQADSNRFVRARVCARVCVRRPLAVDQVTHWLCIAFAFSLPLSRFPLSTFVCHSLCLSLSVSVSLTPTHTQTHTHTCSCPCTSPLLLFRTSCSEAGHDACHWPHRVRFARACLLPAVYQRSQRLSLRAAQTGVQTSHSTTAETDTLCIHNDM